MKNRKTIKGQTTIELMVLLSVSVLALSVIYILYIDQAETMVFSKNSLTMKDSIRKMVDSANKIYYSGRGSQIAVPIEVPDDVNLAASYVEGKTIIFMLSNGSEIFGTADVNFSGTLRNTPGKYFVYLYYDGNVVQISYNEYELNKESLFVSTIQGASKVETFTIRNNTDENITFFLETNFSHPDISLDVDDSDFNVLPGDIRVVTLTFDVGETAYGNYAGGITIKGEVNDLNIEKTFFISVESYLEISSLTIYPRITNITTQDSSDFSICNSTTSNITSIEWTEYDPLNLIDASPDITSVDALTCTDFTLNYSTTPGTYDTNITATSGPISYTSIISFDN